MSQGTQPPKLMQPSKLTQPSNLSTEADGKSLHMRGRGTNQLKDKENMLHCAAVRILLCMYFAAVCSVYGLWIARMYVEYKVCYWSGRALFAQDA